MRVNRLLLLLVFLLGSSCSTIANVQTPFPIPSYIPPECQSNAIATVIPTNAAVAKPTPTVGTNPPLTQTQQLNVFAELVNTINNLYLYPDFNGVDWKGIVARTDAKVKSGLDTEAFYTDMSNLVSALGDNHSQFESPALLKASNAEFSGTDDFVGIGVIVKPMLEKGHLSILSVFPGSAAEHGGLKPHDSLLAVDGLPLVENGISYADRLRGPACSAVRLTIQSPGRKPHDIVLIRYEISAPESIDARLIPTTDGSRIGYIFIPTFYNETIPVQIKKALNDFGPLDGLVLDNRMNGGGSSNVAGPILSYFTSGILGEFLGRKEGRVFALQADPINNSQTVPLVVLVGEDTVSFGEIFAGILQDEGRAKIVGQTTPGKVETLIGHDLSDGSRAWIAEERFDPEHSHVNWEKIGIKPDVEAFADWDTFTFENDPSVFAALKLLGHK
jgi:carboxyl-terminal processing protease